MDWADDVAYSVHDVEDGLHAGLVRLKNLRDPAERSVVSAVARDSYCKPRGQVTAAELERCSPIPARCLLAASASTAAPPRSRRRRT